MSAELPDRPRAETFTVAELVRDAVTGRLRVPPFQRALKWTAGDVAMLLDSLARGYPVGSLLLWRGRPAGDERVMLGPVPIERPASDDLRWIVDGQQRVISLALSLTELGQRDPRFSIWFDPDTRTFHPEPHGGPEPAWMPAHRLLDAASLQEHLYNWHVGTPDRRRAVLEAGARIRDYPVPVYVVSSTDEKPLREVFRRLNQQGKAMEEPDVFDALADQGHRLQDLGPLIAAQGWGPVERATLLKAVLAHAGEDPTRGLAHHGPDADRLTRKTAGMDSAFATTIAFLRHDCHIPCVQALPYELPLVVLPAFFARYRRGTARSRRLLRRWVWRSFFLERQNNPKHVRDAARAVIGVDDEDEAVQGLLALAPRDEPRRWSIQPDLRARADAAHVRIGILGLASLAPLRLDQLGAVDVPAALSTEGTLPNVVRSSGSSWDKTLANRLLHTPMPGVGPAGLRRLLVDSELRGRLASHAIDQAALTALHDDDTHAFLEARARAIERATHVLIEASAEWGAHDRPSLRAVLA